MSSRKGGIAEQVILDVADASSNDELDLPPLYHAVDPDALETVVETLTDGAVNFNYAGYSVTVDCERTISLDRLNARYSAPEPVAGDD
jgi:hypothetical protein